MSAPAFPIRVVVASSNPVKIAATREGFERMFAGTPFEVTPCDVPSGVSSQPMSDAETRQGAANRAIAARARQPDANFWVGIEGGIEALRGHYIAFAWVVVHSSGITGESRSGTFLLPSRVAALVDEGMELGHANDLVFGKHNSKQHAGAVGLLTDGVIDRAQLYEHAMQLALIPFKQEALYGNG